MIHAAHAVAVDEVEIAGLSGPALVIAAIALIIGVLLVIHSLPKR